MIINNITYNSKIFSYDATTIDAKTQTFSINFTMLEKILKDNAILNDDDNLFINTTNIKHGSNNIIISFNDPSKLIRLSIYPSNIDDDFKNNFINEIKIMYKLQELNIGSIIFYPKKITNINHSILISRNISKEYHKFFIIKNYEKGSIGKYMKNKSVIDDKILDSIFSLISICMENNIFCDDIKMENLVLDKDFNVKMIDLTDCMIIDKNKDLNYKIIFESFIYLQVYISLLSSKKDIKDKFISKINSEKFYTSIIILYNLPDDKFLEYYKQIKNLIWYYKNEIKLSFIPNVEYLTVYKILNENINYADKIFKIISKLETEETEKIYIIKITKECLLYVFMFIINEFRNDDNKKIFMEHIRTKSPLSSSTSTSSMSSTSPMSSTEPMSILPSMEMDGKLKKKLKRKSKSKRKRKRKLNLI